MRRMNECKIQGTVKSVLFFYPDYMLAFENTQMIIDTLLPYVPLGYIGVVRWSIWITKKIIGSRYKTVKDNGYTDTLSLVIPVYNEEHDTFRTALESWKNNKPDEIIAVIDHSDQGCIDIFKDFQKKNSSLETTLIVTPKPGKRAALADGMKVAKYNIIALIDSDVIWQENIKDKMLWPFANPEIGGVAPKQIVYKPDTIARRLFDIHLDQRYNDESRYLAVVSNAVTCISGRTAVYRAKAVKPNIVGLENEKFWGELCISGDDKCLTRLIQQDGWKVVYQESAVVMTPGEAKIKMLIKQQTRWARNSYRSDMRSLASSWIWKREKFLAVHMIDRFTQSITLILGPMYFIFSIIWGHFFIASMLLIWWHVSRSIKLIHHFRRHPSDLTMLPIYIGMTYYMVLIKLYAKFTVRKQGWITRWNKDRLNTGRLNIVKKVRAGFPYFAITTIIIILSGLIANTHPITKKTVYGWLETPDTEDVRDNQDFHDTFNK